MLMCIPSVAKQVFLLMSKHLMRITVFFLCIRRHLGFRVMHILVGLVRTRGQLHGCSIVTLKSLAAVTKQINPCILDAF